MPTNAADECSRGSTLGSAEHINRALSVAVGQRQMPLIRCQAVSCDYFPFYALGSHLISSLFSSASSFLGTSVADSGTQHTAS